MENPSQKNSEINQQNCNKQDDLVERGLLDLSIALSTRDITAGKDFTLFVLIKNPFEKQAWIRQVDVSLPDELRVSHKSYTSAESESEKLGNKDKKNSELKSEKENESNLERLIVEISDLKAQLENLDSGSIESNKASSQLKSLSISLTQHLNELREPNLNQGFMQLDGANEGAIRFFSDKSFLNVNGSNAGLIEYYDSRFVEEEQSKSGKISLIGSLPPENALQPGCTTVYTAVLKVDRDFFFTPSQYRLQFNVQYSFTSKPRNHEKVLDDSTQDKIFSNTISHEVSIRPSVRSMLFGAAGGGAIGAVSRVFQVTPAENIQQFYIRDYVNVGISVVPAVILSCVAIIFMARKSDAQSFISVEDFWGGILIGFLVGYTGTSFFQQLTGFSPNMEEIPESSLTAPVNPIRE